MRIAGAAAGAAPASACVKHVSVRLYLQALKYRGVPSSRGGRGGRGVETPPRPPPALHHSDRHTHPRRSAIAPPGGAGRALDGAARRGGPGPRPTRHPAPAARKALHRAGRGRHRGSTRYPGPSAELACIRRAGAAERSSSPSDAARDAMRGVRSAVLLAAAALVACAAGASAQSSLNTESPTYYTVPHSTGPLDRHLWRPQDMCFSSPINRHIT